MDTHQTTQCHNLQEHSPIFLAEPQASCTTSCQTIYEWTFNKGHLPVVVVDLSCISVALVFDILMLKFGFVRKYYKCNGSGIAVPYVDSNMIVQHYTLGTAPGIVTVTKQPAPSKLADQEHLERLRYPRTDCELIVKINLMFNEIHVFLVFCYSMNKHLIF